VNFGTFIASGGCHKSDWRDIQWSKKQTVPPLYRPMAHCLALRCGPQLDVLQNLGRQDTALAAPDVRQNSPPIL
jgi:hypothetical protein